MQPATILRHTKEQFPRIYNTIETLWGYPELQHYLKKIIIDDRDGTRQGFPAEVARELAFIHKPVEAHDVWSINYH